MVVEPWPNAAASPGPFHEGRGKGTAQDRPLQLEPAGVAVPSETTGAALRRGAAALAAAGIENPAREARLLARHVLDLPSTALLDPEQPLHPAAFDALLARRCAREPMAYLTGRQGFWTLDLAVSPATLIPRADSETLIEAALDAHRDRQKVGSILDLGTGTGCLLLAALSEFAAAWGLGMDLSESAVRLARRNAAACGLASRAGFAVGQWSDAIGGMFDLVLSNPPYIETADIAGLMPEVAAHEPRSALDGGADGLNAYRAIVPALPRLLRAGGVAVLEIGWQQGAAVIELAREAGFADAALRVDLGGHARGVVLRA